MKIKLWILFFFLLLFPLPVTALLFRTPEAPPIIIEHDPRVAALTAWMNFHHFQKPYYVKDFLSCADQAQINWRLLPSIALQESSGFKRYPVQTNNGVGWASAHHSFQSIHDSICFVDGQLANGRYYRGKTLESKIKTYNPSPTYEPQIIKFINEIKSYE